MEATMTLAEMFLFFIALAIAFVIAGWLFATALDRWDGNTVLVCLYAAVVAVCFLSGRPDAGVLMIGSAAGFGILLLVLKVLDRR